MNKYSETMLEVQNIAKESGKSISEVLTDLFCDTKQISFLIFLIDAEISSMSSTIEDNSDVSELKSLKTALVNFANGAKSDDQNYNRWISDMIHSNMDSKKNGFLDKLHYNYYYDDNSLKFSVQYGEDGVLRTTATPMVALVSNSKMYINSDTPVKRYLKVLGLILQTFNEGATEQIYYRIIADKIVILEQLMSECKKWKETKIVNIRTSDKFSHDLDYYMQNAKRVKTDIGENEIEYYCSE